jgi:DNA-binding transcriptional LysR family regulator
MHRKWLPLNALRAFEAAGQHLSFTAAANSLTVAQSAVSRHVIVLEKFLGVALFERRPQQLVLTEAGRHLLPIVCKSFDRIDQALSQIVQERGQSKRLLKVLLPPTFAHQLAVPLLKDFRNEHPDLTLEIASRLALSGEGEADIAIAFSQPRVTDTIHDLLRMERLTILCSPDLCGHKCGDLRQLIESADLLHVRIDERPRHYLWDLFVRAIGHPELPVDRGLVFDTAQLAVQYAMSGAGIALVDPFLFADELAAGRLVRPFDVDVADGYGYYLMTHPEQLDNEAVWLFRSWLINRFAKLGGPAGR